MKTENQTLLDAAVKLGIVKALGHKGILDAEQLQKAAGRLIQPDKR